MEAPKGVIDNMATEAESKLRISVPASTVILSGGEVYGCGKPILYNETHNGESINESPMVVLPINAGGNSSISRVKRCYSSIVTFTEDGAVYFTGLNPFKAGRPFVVDKRISLPRDSTDVTDYDENASLVASDANGRLWASRGGLDGRAQILERIVGSLGMQIVTVAVAGGVAVCVNTVGKAFSLSVASATRLGRKVAGELGPIQGLPEGTIIRTALIDFECLYLLDSEGEIWVSGNPYHGGGEKYNPSLYTDDRVTKWPAEDSEMREKDGSLGVEEIFTSDRGMGFARTRAGKWWCWGSIIDTEKGALRSGYPHRDLKRFRPREEKQFEGCKLLFLGDFHAWFAKPPREVPLGQPNVLVWGVNMDGCLGFPSQRQVRKNEKLAKRKDADSEDDDDDDDDDDNGYDSDNEDEDLVAKAILLDGFIYVPKVQRKSAAKRAQVYDDEEAAPKKRKPNGNQSISCGICDERVTRICKNCKRVRYCSGWCASYDWLHGGHRAVCG